MAVVDAYLLEVGDVYEKFSYTSCRCDEPFCGGPDGKYGVYTAISPHAEWVDRAIESSEEKVLLR